MTEPKSPIAGKAKTQLGAAADALAAVTRSQRGKSPRISSKRSSAKTESSAKPPKPSSKPSAGAMPTKVVDMSRKLRPKERETKADKALRLMALNAEPGRIYTLQEIAEVMDVSRERIRQIQDRALRTFRRRLWALLKAEGYDLEELKR